MRYALMTALLLGLLAVGCEKKPEPVKTHSIEPPVRPIETMKPAPPPPRPEPTVEKPKPPAEQPEPEPSPTIYTIQKGDTLWSIAKRLLGDGKRHKEILALNPGLEAKKLPVGKTIKIPPK